RAEQCKGSLIFAGYPPSTAAEADWGDYSAGWFTRALGRSLAESPLATSWQAAIARAEVELRALAPEFNRVAAQGRGTGRAFDLVEPTRDGHPMAGSVGWVQTGDRDRVTVTLAGVSPMLLPYMNAGTRFQTLDGATTLELRSRQGLTAKVEIVESDSSAPLQAGDAIVEVERVLPSNVELAVALCEHLERIEKVDTLGALSSVNLADGFDFIDTHNPHEGLADCMFGKLVEADLASAPAGDSYPATGSYGLFSPGGTPMWDTFGVADEAPKMAVQRLAPRLRHLLAAKRLRMTANDTTSQLALSVTLANDATLWHQSTLAAIASAKPHPTSILDSKTRSHPIAPIQVKAGDRLRCAIENADERSLSVCVFALDSIGTMSALVAPPQVGTLTSFPGRTAIDLDTWLQGTFAVSQPPGPAELMVVASLTPLDATQQRIAAVAQKMGVNHGFIALPHPLELVQTLLDELSASASGGKTSLSTQQWVTLPALYTVV
ncbi:MAG: hypothetical protein AAFY15_06440, partial [Cyanobacteria bacterium J06648_11]